MEQIEQLPSLLLYPPLPPPPQMSIEEQHYQKCKDLEKHKQYFKFAHECKKMYELIKKNISNTNPWCCIDGINTYGFSINSNNINHLISALKLLHYQNKNFLSYDNEPIQGLTTTKSYAFLKLNEENKLVFCLENEYHLYYAILISEE